tara:strand:+ start:912 stop:1337 length:426 start_codon:yes stop_codon:yes gene_type:complete
MIVIIPCGSKKSNEPTLIKNLYKGGYFKWCKKWAESVTSKEKIYILSAKYGFINYLYQKKISPYEVTFNNKINCIAQNILNKQAIYFNIKKAFVLGGKNYIDRCKLAIDDINSIQELYPEKRWGIGYQMQFLKNNLGKQLW